VAAIGDLVHADRDEAMQAALIQLLGDDALDDPPDRVPGDPQRPAIGFLAICWASQATMSSKSRV
jgi:hypothetical protein